MKVLNPRLIPILFCGLISFLCIPQYSNAAVPSSELQALTDMYNTMNGPNWRNRANWLVGDPCSAGWAGISCSGGNVSSINFDYFGLAGSFPNSLSGLRSLSSFSANLGNSITGNMTYIFNLFSTSLDSL